MGQLYVYTQSGWQAAGISIGGAAGGDLTGSYPNPSIATGAVTSGKLASGVVVGYPNINTGFINGYPITYNASDSIQVGCLNYTQPLSVARDRNDAGNIVLSGAINVNVNSSGAGGVDITGLTGTVFTLSGTTLVSGSATQFFTDYQPRTTVISVAASGNTLTAFSGNGFYGFYENQGLVQVGDLVGSTTGSGFFSATSINSGGFSLSITSGFIASGTLISVIETPTFGYSGTFNTVAAIYSNTKMLLTSGYPASMSGTGMRGGKAPGIFMYAWAGAGLSGTTCYLSTQRTAPYGVQNYNNLTRMVGVIYVQTGATITPFQMAGTCNVRTYSYWAENSLLVGGTATTETSVDCTTYLPTLATRTMFHVRYRNTNVGTSAIVNVYFHWIPGTNHYITLAMGNASASVNSVAELTFYMPNLGQRIMYLKDANPGVSVNVVDINLVAFEYNV